MKGVQFLVDANGRQSAVQIDLKRHGELWEDFYDRALAESRKNELREPLEAVLTRISKSRRKRDE